MSKVLEEKIKDIKVNYGNSNNKTDDKNLKNEFEKKVKGDDFQETTLSDVNRYVFSVSKLGWLNCDKFYQSNNSNTNFSIHINEPDKTIVNLVFHRFRSILQGSSESGQITFKNVPIGEKITIVALKTVNNQIFIAVKETEITDKGETAMDFKPVTMDLLKMEIEFLNKINN